MVNLVSVSPKLCAAIWQNNPYVRTEPDASKERSATDERDLLVEGSFDSQKDCSGRGSSSCARVGVRVVPMKAAVPSFNMLRRFTFY